MSVQGSKETSERSGQVTAVGRCAVIQGRQNAVSGLNVRFCRQQTFPRSSSMTELRTRLPLVVGMFVQLVKLTRLNAP